MAAIPFALSIQHFISSVGADAGFAAIIGLAILVLLFFSQARETASLRRRADEAEGELHALQTYMQQLSRTQAAAQATPAPVAAPPASARIAARPAAAPVPSRAVPTQAVPAGAVATIPAAPAGMGAPALSAATRLIPDVDPISIRALRPSTNGQTAHDDEREETAAASVPASPPPSTAAGGSNGVAGRAPVPAPASPQPPTGADTVAPPPRVALRPHTAPPGRPPVPPSRRAAADAEGGRRVSRLALALVSAVVLAAAVVAVILVTNSTGGSSASTSTTRASQTSSAGKTSSRRHRAQAGANSAAVSPTSVTVAVLNGTSTPSLAADVMAKLAGAGYKKGAVTNAPDQALTSTIVGYTQPAYRNDALAVARSLRLGSASVQGVNQGDRTAACSSTPTSCPAQVVVTVGADLSSAG